MPRDSDGNYYYESPDWQEKLDTSSGGGYGERGSLAGDNLEDYGISEVQWGESDRPGEFHWWSEVDERFTTQKDANLWARTLKETGREHMAAIYVHYDEYDDLWIVEVDYEVDY